MVHSRACTQRFFPLYEVGGLPKGGGGVRGGGVRGGGIFFSINAVDSELIPES